MYQHDEAEAATRRLIALLVDTCARIEIAGSIRRGRPVVKDAELVVEPVHLPTFLARVDRLVVERQISKADITTRPAWGSKYRKLMYHGLKVDLFITDHHSFGYQYWLRTGPAEANEWIMRQLYGRALAFREGAGWHGGKRVSLPDEHALFRALGMPYQSPKWRTVERYKSLFRAENIARHVEYVADVEMVADDTQTLHQKGLW